VVLVEPLLNPVSKPPGSKSTLEHHLFSGEGWCARGGLADTWWTDEHAADWLAVRGRERHASLALRQQTLALHVTLFLADSHKN
jgi:hypothetical protein